MTRCLVSREQYEIVLIIQGDKTINPSEQVRTLRISGDSGTTRTARNEHMTLFITLSMSTTCRSHPAGRKRPNNINN